MNERIRAALAVRNIKQYELAKELGVREDSFSRKMRYEMPAEEQEQILATIYKRWCSTDTEDKRVVTVVNNLKDIQSWAYQMNTKMPGIVYEGLAKRMAEAISLIYDLNIKNEL